MTRRLIRRTTALAVVAVTGVAAIISCQHACELVRSHGESGTTARLLPFTVDGLIWRRWPTAGALPGFVSAADYDQAVADLVRSGVITDPA